MAAYHIFMIGPCRLFIDKSYLGSYHSFWTWKLDPYRIYPADDCRPEHKDIVIEINKAENCTFGSLLSVRSMGFFELRCHQTDHGCLYRYVRKSNEAVLVEWHESRDMHHYELIRDDSGTDGALSFELLGRILEGALENTGVLVMHGALIEYNGEGIVISAPSGTGKTTHARLWRDYKDALIINGDVSALVKQNQTWYGFGLPWSGSSGEQINRRVPVKKIIILEQSGTNEAEALTGLTAYRQVLSNCRYPYWLPDKAINAIDLAASLTENLSVIRLKCRPDTGAVDALLDIFH